MKVSRRRGEVRLRLDPVEVHILAAVLADLVDTLAADALAADDPVRQRLFPAGYRDDDRAAADFRSLTEESLRSERIERARQCIAEIGAGTAADLLLDAEAGQRWIAVLNDVRLALGTRLGISEEEPDDDPDAPDFEERALYYWLTGLQDALVRLLMP